jgi:copper resistance protein B
MKYIIIALLATGLWSENANAQNAADDYYDPAEMAAARRALKEGAGGGINYLFLGDRLEYLSAGDGTSIWDFQGWVGGDINRLWFKSQGEFNSRTDNLEGGELEVLYGRAISPFFDLQAGIGQGLESGPSQSYGVIGIQGLAPQWFEVDLAMRLSTDGDVTASLEAEYDLLLSQRLIMQPRFETALSIQDIPELGLGSGFSSFEFGLRLRYEIKRQFAPYVGVSWQRKLGGTADFARLAGDDPGEVSFLIGIKTWF